MIFKHSQSEIWLYCCQKVSTEKKLGLRGHYLGVLARSKNHKNVQNKAFWEPPKIPLSDPIVPKFCLLVHFDFNLVIFYFENV